MNTDDLRHLADNPSFIAGIHNYCDRWCERCAYTARCMNYAMGQRQFGDLDEAKQLPDEKFWAGMEATFRLTLEMIAEDLAAQGIDFAEALAEASEEDPSLVTDADWAQPLVQRAQMYIEMTDRWFLDSQEAFHDKVEVLQSMIDLNVGSETAVGEASLIKDAAEVIRWYLYQIEVKLLRAISSRRDEANDPALWEEFGRDSDGSAKVALIGLDRTIGAWGVLLRAFPERELEALRVLAHLDRLRREAEQEFPDARAFVRPGFDTGESPVA